MNMDVLKAQRERLAANSRDFGSKLLWKPEPGAQIIRIVPYIHNQDTPFTEVYMHYDCVKTPVVSPITYGRRDPIKEFSEKIRENAAGNREMYKLADMLDPKVRMYVPIIIRGRELEGVKFWGVTPKTFGELMQFSDEPAYGDFSDPVTGYDLKVTYTKATVPGTYPSTSILPMPKSQVTDRQDVLQLLAQMPDILTLWKEPSTAELEDILRRFTENGNTKVDVKPGSAQPAQNASPTGNVPGSVPSQGAVPNPYPNNVNPPASTPYPNANIPVGGNQIDVRASFDQYFKKQA